MTHTCRICYNSASNVVWHVREMMFGQGVSFPYFECSKCGCLQIVEVPTNLGKYYPPQYYSFAQPVLSDSSSFLPFLKRARFDYLVNRKNVLGRLTVAIRGEPTILSAIARAGASRDQNILDVGCGSGRLLLYLASIGFRRLTGIDPYVETDIRYENGVRILKRQLDDLDERFDLIMLHHSFEHVREPLSTLEHLHRLLNPNCLLLLRMPTVDSFAWRNYRANWVQLDAPRHLHLHSKRSLELLAGQSGFTFEGLKYDSWAIQFWGSEQYARGIPLMDPRSIAQDRKSTLFTSAELARFDKQSVELNRKGDGDQAAFYLRRI